MSSGITMMGMLTILTVVIPVVLAATPPVPSIDSIEPAFGEIGSEIAINGSNFSSIANDNQVCFGEIEAHVISASPEQLIVTVPGSIRYAPMFFGGVQVAMRTSDRILQGGGDSSRGGLALSTHA